MALEEELDTHGLKINMDALEELVNALDKLDELTQEVRNQRPDMANERLHVQAGYNPYDGDIYSYTLLLGGYMEWAHDLIPFGDWDAPISRQTILDTLFKATWQWIHEGTDDNDDYTVEYED